MINNAYVIKRILFVLIATIILFYEALINMFYLWGSYGGSHGPLILIVSLYLVYMNRGDLKKLPLSPSIIPGTILTFIGSFLLFAGKISNTILLQQVSLVPFLLGFILLLFGYSFFKLLFLPVGYLIFMTGFFEQLFADVAIYLQLISAWIAAKLLMGIGMPVVLDGILIDLPHISLEVARVCSGSSHIVAIMALSIPLGIFHNLPMVRKLFLIGASFFIGIFANGLRIALIGVYALYNKNADLHGPNETLAVSVIFLIGMILLGILSYSIRPRKPSPTEDKNTQSHDSSNTDSFGTKGSQSTYHSSAHRLSFVIAGLLFISSFGFIYFYTVKPAYLNITLREFPNQIGDYRGQAIESMDERLRPFEADDEYIGSFNDMQGNFVNVYVGYFAEQDRSRKIIDYRRDWLHHYAEAVDIATHNVSNVQINKTVLRNRHNPSEVYFWYVIDDRIVTSQYAGKIYTFLDALLKRRTNGAVVVVQTHSNQEEVMPFLEELVPVVMEFVVSGKSRIQKSEY